MESLESIWLIAVIALISGAVIGILCYRLFAPSVKQAEIVKAELDAAREELTQYKASVNEHFDKTSELVSDMTKSYARVYRHLAEGSQALGGSTAFANLLEQDAGSVSIAVDDEIVAVDEVVDNAPGETEGEPAESLTGVNTSKSEPVNPEDEATGIEVSDPLVDDSHPVDATENAPRVDTAEETTDSTGGEASSNQGQVTIPKS